MRWLLVVAALAVAGVVTVSCWKPSVARAAGLAAPDEVSDAIAPDAAAIADEEADDVKGDEADREAIADEEADDVDADEADREAIADEEADDVKGDEADTEAIADERADDADADAADAKAIADEAPDVAEDAAPPAVGDTSAAPKDVSDRVVLESLKLSNHVPSQVELSFSDVPQRPTAQTIEARDGKPQRVVVDFPGATLAKSVPTSSRGSGRVAQVRAGQYKPDVSRVVLELTEPWPTVVRLRKDKVVIQLQPEMPRAMTIRPVQ